MVEYFAAAIHVVMGIAYMMSEEYVFGICYIILGALLAVSGQRVRNLKSTLSDLVRQHTSYLNSKMSELMNAAKESTQPPLSATSGL